MTALVSLESAPCPMGCPPGDVVVLTARDLIHDLPGEFTIVRCRTCGLQRTDPRPTPEAIGFYYPDTYAPYRSSAVAGDSNRQPSVKLRVSNWLARHLDLGWKSLPDMPPGRMLEIGCAAGGFLQEMADRGWQVEGIEPSASTAARAVANGLAVEASSLESAQERDAVYDLIVGWMVLEHLHQPAQALQKLARWARPGAALVLSTPDASAAGLRIFGPRWFPLHLPNHLFHFTPATTEAMLAATGWRVERIVHHRVLTNFTFSLSYLLRDRGWPRAARGMAACATYRNGILNYVCFPVGWLFGLIRQTGQITVWARRE